MKIIAAAIVLICALCGGGLTRLHGSETKIPRWVIQVVYSLIWTYPALRGGFFVPNEILSAISFGSSFDAISLGHGREQSLKEPLKGSREWVEIPVLFLIPLLSSYWYKVIVLMINGLLLVSGGLIAMLWNENYIGASVIAFGGLLTSAGYMIGWFFYPQETGKNFLGFTQATQVGEFLEGFFCVGFLSLAMELS